MSKLRLMSYLFLLISVLSTIETHSAQLPDCPLGISLLDESYPAVAVVMSDVASKGYENEKLALLRKFIPEVLQSSNAKVLLIAKKNNFDSLTRGLPTPLKSRVLRLHKLPLTNWMQDPWVVQAGSTNGNLLLRPLKKYNGDNFDSLKLVEAVRNALNASSSASVGPMLEIGKRSEALSGQYGGNFLAMGSLCLVGSSNLKNQFQKVAGDVCGGDDNILKVPTSFLNVGHADEIVKALAVSSPKPGGCSMALAIASPRRAKKILEDHPEDLLFDFRDNEQKPLSKSEALLQIKDRRFYRLLCMRMMGIHRQYISTGMKDEPFPIEDNGEGLDPTPCLAFKNKDFLKFIKENSYYEKAHEPIQENFDHFVAQLKEQFRAKNQNCELQVIELPQLFAGKIRQNLLNGFKPRMESAQSLFPNPSNGELFGDTYFLPDPVNPSFRSDLIQSLKGLKIRPVFLNTHFSHRLLGNFHCMEKTLRACKAVKVQAQAP